MNLQELDTTCRVVRRVVVNSAQVVTVSDILEDRWPARLIPPTSEHGGDDASPRDNSPYIIRYARFLFRPPGATLRAGDRVEERETGLAFELLRDPRTLREGRREVGWEVSALPVSTLYPLNGSIQEQGGDEVVDDVDFALWGGSENRTDRGEYEDRDGEVPVEYSSELRSNRQLVTSSQTLRILEAVVDTEGPRVKVRARRAGG